MPPCLALQRAARNLLSSQKGKREEESLDRRAGSRHYTFTCNGLQDYKQHLRSFISAVGALTKRRTRVIPSETKMPKTTCSRAHKSGIISAREGT